MSKFTKDPGIDKVKDPAEQARFISQIFEELRSLLNNGLSLSDNFGGKIMSVTFSAANTDTAVTHGLGRVATQYIPLRLSANMVIYDGAAAATSTSTYLKSSAAGTISLWIF
jgi:hypothetical protein